MIAIFQQMIPILEEIRTFLLNETMVVMDPEYIYKDLEDDSIHILILPWRQEEKTIHKLAEFFLEKINHRDENGVNAAYLFYRQQNQSQFSLYQFLPILEKESILKRQKMQEKKNILLESNTNSTAIWQETTEKMTEIPYDNDLEKNVSKENASKWDRKLAVIFFILAIFVVIFSFLPKLSSILKLSCRALSLLFMIVSFFFFLAKKKEGDKETQKDVQKEYFTPESDLSIKETVFFDAAEEDYYKLQWKEKGRKKQFILRDFPCTIGKIKEEVAIVISDPSVSRVHCRFVERENKVCIMDLNSTNGTYLNGLPIKNGEILEIEKNDEILIGKVSISVV